MVLRSYVVPRCVIPPKRIAKFACLLMSRMYFGGGALWSKIVGMLKNIFTNRWSCVVCASLLIFYSTQLARLQSCFVPHSIHNMHAFHTSMFKTFFFVPQLQTIHPSCLPWLKNSINPLKCWDDFAPYKGYIYVMNTPSESVPLIL